MRIAIVLATFLTTLLQAAVGQGTTFFVSPGPGTAVQDAIDAANDGDTIRLTIGVYPEHLFIAKSIKLRGVRSTSVEANQTTQVGSGCGIAATIRIVANDVQLRGLLILGDSLGGVDLQGNRIKLTDVFVNPRCESVSAPIYSISGGNDVGVLLENNGIGSVRVSRSAVNYNLRGIVLQNTSRAIVDHNTRVQNTTSGIELDATSSGNTLVRNDVSGSTTDVSDAGSANCWRNNTYVTGSVPTCP